MPRVYYEDQPDKEVNRDYRSLGGIIVDKCHRGWWEPGLLVAAAATPPEKEEAGFGPLGVALGASPAEVHSPG